MADSSAAYSENSPLTSLSTQEEDFDQLEQMAFIRLLDMQSGAPCKVGHSNQVILVIARNFQAKLCRDRAKLIRFLELKCGHISQNPYSILWLHTQATYLENSPGLDFLYSCFMSQSGGLPSHFRSNLSSVVVLHPSLALWAAVLFILPWMGGLWRKVHWVHRIEFLTDYWPSFPLQDLPSFVMGHDEVLEDQPLADYGTWVASRDDLKSIGVPTPL